MKIFYYVSILPYALSEPYLCHCNTPVLPSFSIPILILTVAVNIAHCGSIHTLYEIARSGKTQRPSAIEQLVRSGAYDIVSTGNDLIGRMATFCHKKKLCVGAIDFALNTDKRRITLNHLPMKLVGLTGGIGSGKYILSIFLMLLRPLSCWNIR